MFVKDNSVGSARIYFNNRLSELFSLSELKLMFNEFLIARLKISRNDLHFSDQLKLSESDLLYFRSCVHRLKDNEPFQYILGSTEFYGLEILCDRRALIPRPETEELVDWIVKEHATIEPLEILDLCTGTGCITLALKSLLGHSNVVGIDVSEDALSLAKENALKNNLEVAFRKLNLLNFQSDEFLKTEYDIWVSNPPYIPVSEKKSMHSNVLDFEPEIALFVADNDPLIFYRIIAEQGLKHLKTGGKLYFEIHENLGNEMLQLLSNLGYASLELKADMQGKNRMLKGVKAE